MNITKTTTRDDITLHLADAGISYELGIEQDSVRIDRRDGGGCLLVLWRHAPNEGDGVANLWAWCETDQEGEQCSGGLDSFSELDELVADAA